MSLKIRLARGGSKKKPVYRIVVAEARSPRDGRFLVKLGSYNPTLPDGHPGRLTLDVEAAADWMRKGAQPTDRVARYLAAAGVGNWVAGNNPNKGEPGKKAQERAAEKAEKAEALAAAAAEASAAPVAAVEETVVEEVAVEEAAPEAPAEASDEAAPASEG